MEVGVTPALVRDLTIRKYTNSAAAARSVPHWRRRISPLSSVPIRHGALPVSTTRGRHRLSEQGVRCLCAVGLTRFSGVQAMRAKASANAMATTLQERAQSARSSGRSNSSPVIAWLRPPLLTIVPSTLLPDRRRNRALLLSSR